MEIILGKSKKFADLGYGDLMISIDTGQYSHGVISGKTNSGKSTLLLRIIAQVGLNGGRVWYVDEKGYDLKQFRGEGVRLFEQEKAVEGIKGFYSNVFIERKTGRDKVIEKS